MIEFENGIFPISIDYKNSLEELIALGKYDDISREITSDVFLLSNNYEQKASKAVIELAYSSEKLISVSDFVKNLAHIGYHPLGIRELLVFGAKYSDIQLKFPILELGDIGLWEEKLNDGTVYKYADCLFIYKNPYKLLNRSLRVRGAGDTIFNYHQRIIVTRNKALCVNT